MSILMLLCLLVPVISGLALKCVKNDIKDKRKIFILSLLLECVLVIITILDEPQGFCLFAMTDTLKVYLKIDGLSKLFMLIASFGFLIAGVFAIKYMEHEKNAFPEENFYMFYLLSLFGLIGMDMSGNLISMYFFFEMITLLSMPLVLHEKNKESISAALKYLFYSIAGAFLALGCIFVLANYVKDLNFIAGGSLDLVKAKGHEGLLMTMILLGLIGFGAKAGMYPLHGWLPTAHPVAPAPASAVLSGIITKAGVLAIIRIIYYVVGVDYLYGSFVQYALLTLSLITVFMGSMMAYKEKVLKKRLAYSSVSQISYVLFGLFLFNETAFVGSMMQILFHATVKICLFLFAGSIIFNTGFHHVDELKGYGKAMPLTFICFTLASLSLIGIPPFAGFVSKWYLAMGALNSGLEVFNFLGPVVLLISALLTAGYLLPITIDGFFPGENITVPKCSEGGKKMLIPLIILATLALLFGLISGFLYPSFVSLTRGLF